MSDYLALSGAPLIRADIRLPLVGTWVADVEHVETPTVAEGDQVTLTLGSQSWVGTVLRVEVSEGRRWDCRIVGGGGGLGTSLATKQYRSPPASLVYQDALAEAGESTDLATLAALSGTLLRGWVRRQATLGQELDALSRLLGKRWRILPSGAVWIGEDTGTPVAVSDAQVLEEDAARGLVLLAANDPTVTPGQTWTTGSASWEVGAVVHRVDELSTRTEVWRSSGPGRLGEMLDQVAKTAAPPDLFAAYEYTVILDNGDGTVELRSGHEELPDLSRVPAAPGVPGASWTVPPGARCYVAFRGGSEQDPYVAAWVSGTPVALSLPVSSLLHLGATSAADFVALDGLVQAQLSAIKSAISTAAVVAGDGGASFKAAILASLAGWPATTAATRVKAT